ncbi:hypothetical protein K0M31_010682 [Melipona bicolor]|uniref:Uncharacterized protein n=1 Tax=Melipona bicolor TaxID=60889 RepID=A0AA40FKP2_9HYME|nr:hypothetical protein K0M31_010682 [Melipona bicolor]
MQDAKTYEKRTVNAFRLQTAIDMSEKKLSMGINVSILVILAIFGVLLSLPLRLLLNTNYHESRNKTLDENNTILATESITIKTVVIPVDHRKLKRCPKFEYEDRLQSVFQSDYDGNCTYTRVCTTNDSKQKNNGEDENEPVNGREDNETFNEILKEIVSENLTKKVEESGKDRRTKSVLVAGHILVTMLLISAIAALVEVLRIRFAKDKAGSINSRKTSTIDFSVQRRFLPRYPMKSARSFEMHRSALRLLGARPPPLIRRSSFPTQPSKQSSGSISGTPNTRISRRQSAESDEEIRALISALHHRTRLIRRH